MTPAEKQAFDAMREALCQLQRHHSEMVSLHGHGFAHFVCKLIDTAALAADAVAEQGQGPQSEFDLTTLITNGAKAWAGVNAQDLREGKPVGEPPAEALGESQPKPLGWYCVSADGMATLCVDGDNARKVAKEADFLWPRHGPHKAMQLCEYQYSTPKE